MPELMVMAERQRGADGRAEIHCAGCGYGAVVARLPERCPMCGSTSWRPQSKFVAVTRRLKEEQAMKRIELGFAGEGR